MDPYTLSTMTLGELLKEQERVRQAQARYFKEGGVSYLAAIEFALRSRFGITEADHERFANKTTGEVIRSDASLR